MCRRGLLPRSLALVQTEEIPGSQHLTSLGVTGKQCKGILEGSSHQTPLGERLNLYSSGRRWSLQNDLLTRLEWLTS